MKEKNMVMNNILSSKESFKVSLKENQFPDWVDVARFEGGITARLKVPGGWLYRELAWNENNPTGTTSVALVFVPDY